MNTIKIINNQAIIAGTIVSPFSLNYEYKETRLYSAKIAIHRQSGVTDTIIFRLHEEMMPQIDCTGMRVKIEGQFRSYLLHMETKNKLLLYVHAKNVVFGQDASEDDINIVTLRGFTCKESVYRTTPSEKKICDILLAVNRWNKSDYIPCIAWSKNALSLSEYGVGTKISITGRIQSREYTKVLEDGTREKRTAYELSISQYKKMADPSVIKSRDVNVTNRES